MRGRRSEPAKLPDYAFSPFWRPVPGYGGKYWVSYDGRVLSRCRGPEARLLKPTKNQDGYICYNLYETNKRAKVRLAHQLVAETFIGPRPSPIHVICHTDGNRLNNSQSNLRYDLPDGNNADAVKHGSHKGERNAAAQMCAKCASVAKGLLAIGMPVTAVARLFGVSDTAMVYIKKGKNWSHVDAPVNLTFRGKSMPLPQLEEEAPALDSGSASGLP